jgi:SAM-dependent methyltransferase
MEEAIKQNYWNAKTKTDLTRDNLREKYDGWLEKHGILCKNGGAVLELGAGTGIDTLHLVEAGYTVTACDFAPNAIATIKRAIPEVDAIQFNMAETFPFETEQFDMIIANKCLHYFTEKRTLELFDKIHNALKPNGTFAFIVNSVADYRGGAKEIEENYYEFAGANTKRFFDEQALRKFISAKEWEVSIMEEQVETSERLQILSNELKSKTDWICVLKK